MKTQQVLGCFDWMLRRYPPRFQQEFGAEMAGVFAQAADDAAAQGKLWLLFLRELRHWPARLLSEHFQSWTDVIQRRIQMNADKLSANWRIEDRRQALYAALMPVVIGLGIGLKSAVIWTDYSQLPSWRIYLALAILVLSMLATIVVGAIAVLRKLPDWGFIWAGGGLMAGVLGLQVLAEERIEQGASGLISPAADMALMVVIMLLGLALLIAGAWRGWQQAGLVSLGMASLTALELFNAVSYAPYNRHLLSLLAIPAGLLIGGLVYLYCRRNEGVRLAALAGIAVLNIGAVMVANQVWQTDAARAGLATPVVPLLVLLNGLLLAGPVIGAIGKPIRRRMLGT